MQYIHRFIISILCFCLLACTNSSKELNQAEQLMDTAPDSAFQVLKHINQSQLFTPSHKALYALLMSQALDKHDIKVESDSLIHIATDYYNESEPQHAAYAWFYSARIANNSGNAKSQADALLKAQEYAEKTENSKLKGLVYDDKGALYRSQKQFDSSILYFKKSYTVFRKIKDRRNSILCLLRIGEAYINNSQYDSTKIYYHLAEKYAYQLNDKIIQSTINRGLGSMYLHVDNFPKALLYYHKVPLTHITTYDSNKWLLIANVYIIMGNTDSTRIYLNKINELNESAPFYNKLWVSLYEKEGNTAKALYYSKRATTATDSLYKTKLDVSFAGLETKYKFQGLQLDKQQLTIQKKQYRIVILIVLLGLSVFTVMVLNWRNKVNKQQVEMQAKQVEAQKQQVELQKQLVLKEHALLENEKEKLQHEVENNALLETKNKMQGILLSNLEQYRNHSVKRHQYPNEKNIISPILNLTFHEELIANMDIQHRDISKRLMVDYPTLTPHDILLCCFILANFETGMIAASLDVKNHSVLMHRSRLRTKLNLPTSADLLAFLHHF